MLDSTVVNELSSYSGSSVIVASVVAANDHFGAIEFPSGTVCAADKVHTAY